MAEANAKIALSDVLIIDDMGTPQANTDHQDGYCPAARKRKRELLDF